MQSQVILLSNVKQDNVAQLVQKEFEMLGITGIKGKRIDAERAAIHKTVAESLGDYNVIMIIGGIGENNSDMTVSAVSSAIGFQTVQKDGELFPEGAEILRNKNGKPSGCAISQGNQCIIMLPGEAADLQFMLCYRAFPYLADFVGGAYSIKTLRAEKISKAEAEEKIAAAETFGTFTRVFEDENEIAVRIYGKGADKKEASANVNSALKEIVHSLGSAVYAVGAENVGQAFGQELSRKDLKASIAVEGIQRSEIASAAFVEEYVGNYLGTSQGLSKYDIPEQLLKRHGANSTWTAAVLAGEVCKTYGSNIGIAITTDPSKNNDGANVAVCMGDNVWTEHVTAETREELIAVAASRAIHLARCVVSAYPKLYENSVSLMAAVSGKSKFKTSVSKGSQKWYSRFIPMKGDSKSELIRKSVFVLCVLVFLGCMGYLSTKLFDSVNNRNLAANLGSMVGKTDPEHIPNEWDYNPKLYDLYKENPDTIGYIQIDGTNVAFPIVQTDRANDKGDKGQFYLRKDFYKQYSMYGTPFLDYRCDAQVEMQSTNLIVYGHNVYNDGQMFSDLIKYRQLKFYKEHPVIHFDTLYGDADWLVVGVILTNAYEKDGPVWDYNNFINGNEAETKEFLNQVAKRTMIVTGVDYNTSDHFLTLSTCSYDFTDARVVIIARQVREGEDVSAFNSSKAYYNSNPLMPDKWYQAVSEAQQSESDASFGEAEQIGGAIEEIEIISLPKKTVYKVGEEICLEGLKFLVYRTDAVEPEEVVGGYTSSPHGSFDTPGEYEITIDYEGYKFKIRITVVANESSGSEAQIESIEIIRKPDSYNIGAVPKESDFAIRVKKTDGSTEDIGSGFSVSGDTGKVGNAKFTVTYKEFSATANVEIKPIASKIEITSLPAKVEYKVGEKLDLTGIVLKVTKLDGTVEENVKTGFTYAPMEALNNAGDVTVTVSYGGANTTFVVKVKPAEIKAESIAIASKPSKTTYNVGESLDVSGLSIEVTKNDGTKETLTSGFSVSPSGALNTAGTVTVTVTYEGLSATFNVTVNPVVSLPESGSSSESSSTASESSSSNSTSESNNSGSTENSTSSSTSESVPESSDPVNASNLGTTYSGQSRYYQQSLKDTVKVNGNTMTVYDAVCQIVAYEAGQGQPEEHVKAQTVATYTYLMNGGGNISAGLSTAKLDSRTKRIVAEVIGYAVLDDRSNNFILATYFSESCGETANAEWVWGYANRNLISVSSPVDGKSVKTYRITSASFKEKIESKTGIKLTGNPESWISVYSRFGSTEYVDKVDLCGTKYSARKLRESVLGGANLRSTAFDVEYDSAKDQFVFTMRGYGHGVGMSAVGSIAYAKQGYTWEEILMKYYSNCYIGFKTPK